MTTRFRFSDAAALVVGLLLTLWSAREVLAGQPLCLSQGYMDCQPDEAHPGNQPCIICTGNCGDTDPNTNCALGSGSNPVLGGYTFCTCPGEGEPTCCHLIKRDNTGSSGFMSQGNCQSQEAVCPPGNFCTKTGSGVVGDPWMHECETH